MRSWIKGQPFFGIFLLYFYNRLVPTNSLILHGNTLVLNPDKYAIMQTIYPFKHKIGFGTSGFGNLSSLYKRDLESLVSALSVGYKFFDTAEKYGDGKCETLLGNAIREWGGLRSDIQIVSKVLPDNATSKQSVIDACDRSLDRLQTDYLDVYLLHWRKPETNLMATVEAFAELQSKGKIQHFGLSNFNPQGLADWRECEIKLGIEKGASVLQTRYSLAERLVDRFMLNHVKEKYQMSVMAHTPLKLGGMLMQYNSLLEPLALENSCTVAQLCLAWIIRHPHVVTMPKSSQRERQIENLAATGITLTASTIEQLNQMFPIPLPVMK